jgi:hypothetical protein
MLNLGVRCQSPCHAPSVRGAIVLLMYVVLDCDQFYFCRVACLVGHLVGAFSLLVMTS